MFPTTVPGSILKVSQISKAKKPRPLTVYGFGGLGESQVWRTAGPLQKGEISQSMLSEAPRERESRSLLMSRVVAQMLFGNPKP